MVSPLLAATGPAASLDPPLWAGLPFVLLLLAIALLPLTYRHFWEPNRNKALVAALLALPVVVYLLRAEAPVGPEPRVSPAGLFGVGALESLRGGGPGAQALRHSLAEYAAFIILLGSLYTVSGGIAIRTSLSPTPLNNTAILALGSVLASVIGTTGASMLLVRPILRMNRCRRHTSHLPVFFIILVGNLGGLLTPLGDPPLFLGFLNGVSFLWTLSLLPHWLLVNGAVLAAFLAWDSLAYRREQPETLTGPEGEREPFRVRGLVNTVFLAGILLAVVLQSRHIGAAVEAWVTPAVSNLSLHLSSWQSAGLMLALAAGSLLLTPRGVREANGFSWGAITEVAILFAGIFVTMVPALAWLGRHGPGLGIDQPWEYFWLSGGLSSVLDNAPTYMTFATLAAGGDDLGTLMHTQPLVLQAISCGAVLMGANTYIGNGPNLMVKAIADESGFKTPSFFGYMAYTAAVLLPVFALVTWLFFAKGS